MYPIEFVNDFLLLFECKIGRITQMRAYELTLVLRSSLKDDERKKLLTTVKGFFGDANFVKENEWGEKPLSYAIKRETSGYFIHMMLETEGAISPDFERRLLTNDNVLRQLFVRGKDKKVKEKGSVINDEGLKTKAKVQKAEKPKKEAKAAAPAKKAIKKTKKK